MIFVGARIQIRRGSAAFWDSENPILHDGEPGFEKDTRKWKVGDGNLPWRELPYMGELSDPTPTSDAALYAHIQSATPHPAYDDAPSFALLYQNAKV